MRYAFFNSEGRVDSAHNDDMATALPEGAVELTDDQFADRFNLKLVKGNLAFSPVAPTQPGAEEILAEVDRKRTAAYRTEAEPLFFKSQRGECSVEEWQEKVSEIRLRYPK